MTGKKLFIPMVALAMSGIAAYSFYSASGAYTPRDSQFNYVAAKTGKNFSGAAAYAHAIKANLQTGTVDLKDIFAAEDQVEALALSKSRGALGLVWEEIGPDNVGGRTRAFLIDTVSGRYYSGGVTGGMWYSDDQGGTWKKVNDHAENLAVSCMTQAANGDIYYGTGEYFAFQGGGIAYNTAGAIGRGVFKSTNGIDFANLENTNPRELQPSTGGNSSNHDWALIADIQAHPTNEKIIYVGTHRGLRVTTDGGETWEADWLKSGPVNVTTAVQDIDFLADGSLLLTTANNIYYSPDGTENSFTSIKPGPASVLAGVSGRVEVAGAPGNPNIIYATFINRTGGNLGLLHSVWVTEDKGANWTMIGKVSGNVAGQEVPTFNPCGSNGQCFYDLTMLVHPNNPGELYLGGVQLWRWKKINLSPVSGAWERIAVENPSHPSNPFYVHADKHNILTVPGSPFELMITTDGGNYRTPNRGVTYFAQNKNYNVTQFYSVAFSGTGEVIGGTQDNGSQYVDPAISRRALEVTGGDGGYAEISQINNNILFSSIYYGDVYRSEDKGASMNTFFSAVLADGVGLPEDGKASFVTPVRLWESFNDPLSPDSVYYFNLTEDPIPAGTVVTVNSGTNRYPFQHTLPVSLAAGDSILVPDPVQAQLALGLVNSVWMNMNPLNFEEPPIWIKLGNVTGTTQPMRFTSDGNTLFVGTRTSTGGHVYRIDNLSGLRKIDATDSLTQPLNPNLSVTLIGSFGQVVNDIDVDPNNNNNVVIVLGNYGNNNYVYRSTTAMTATDHGSANWVAKQGAGNSMLPRMPIYSVVIDKTDGNRVILGTEYGIYSTANITAVSPQWTDENETFPRVPTYMIRQQILPNNWNRKILNSGCIYAGTHGRGFWKTCTLGSPDVSVEEKPEPIPTNAFRVYPNPAANYTYTEIILGETQKVKAQIYDMSGKLVSNRDFGTLQSGAHKLTLNTADLAPGNYIIAIQGDQFRKAERLSIVR